MVFGVRRLTIRKKMTYVNIGARRYRYIEILQEILPELIDLTKEDESTGTNGNNSSPASPTFTPTSPAYRSPTYSPTSPAYYHDYRY